MLILGPVAVADNLVIGNGNDLPWHLPEDLKHFKLLTMGKTVLMGRKTYESIVKRLGKPLPGRKSVVISRQTGYNVPEGVLVFHDLKTAIENLKSEDIYVIGGSEIFNMALPLAKKMYVTHVAGNFQGDAYFPPINWDEWEKVGEDKHQGFSFSVYIKK
jgi:dihydrofolate reductase